MSVGQRNDDLSEAGPGRPPAAARAGAAMARADRGPRRERLRAVRLGGIAGFAATAMLVTAPGAMAASTSTPSDPCDAGEVVSNAMRADCHGDDLGTDAFPRPGSEASGEAGPEEPGERGGEGSRPGRPGPWAAEPVAPEAKGRVYAHLVRGTAKVRAGATVNYRLDLDVRGTVGAVTVDLETNLGIWLFADVARTHQSGAAEEGSGSTANEPARIVTSPGARLRCAIVGGEKVRCSADELKGPGQVKLKLRLPERTDVPELRVSGQVTSDGAVDAFTDTAPLAKAAPKGERQDGRPGGGADKDTEDAKDAKGMRNAKKAGARPAAVSPDIPRPVLPPIRTVNVASLPLDHSPPKLPEVGPVGMPGAAPQRPAPAAAHRTQTVAGTTTTEDTIPDGAAIALGIGGLAILLAGGIYGRSALRKD